MSKSLQNFTGCCFATLALLIAGCPVNNVQIPPTPVVPEISDQQTKWVQPVIPYQDGELSEFYTEFADVVRRDSEIIKSTGHIREAHVRAGKLMFQQRRVSNPDLAAAIDSAFETALGLENVELTDEKRREVILLLEALAWALAS